MAFRPASLATVVVLLLAIGVGAFSAVATWLA